MKYLMVLFLLASGSIHTIHAAGRTPPSAIYIDVTLTEPAPTDVSLRIQNADFPLYDYAVGGRPILRAGRTRIRIAVDMKHSKLAEVKFFEVVGMYEYNGKSWESYSERIPNVLGTYPVTLPKFHDSTITGASPMPQ